MKRPVQTAAIPGLREVCGAGSLPCTVFLGRGLAELPVSQFAPSPFLGRCRTGRTHHLCTPRGVNLCLAPSPATGLGTAGTEGMGQFQSELRRCLCCSLAVLCSGFWLFWPQPFGVSFCERLLSVVSRTLHVSGRAGAGGPRLTLHLAISGHFMCSSNEKCKKRRLNK